MQAVGQRGEALHMAQSQQAAEEAVQGGLVLALLLELLSQLEEALPPPVQHPQSQPETSEPPIRVPPAQDKSSPPLLSSSGCRRCTQTPQVERGSRQPVRELPDEESEPASAHCSSEGSPRRREASGRASAPASQGQVARSRLRQRRRLARRPDPFPLLAPPLSPLAGCTRKGGQRKWESIHSVSGSADGQSLLCSALLFSAGSSAGLCSAQPAFSLVLEEEEDCKAGGVDSKSTNCCPCSYIFT